MKAQAARTLILASNSPRRRTLLAEAGFEYETASPTVVEPEPGQMDPQAYAVHTSWLKARDVAARYDGPCAILAADTVVAVGDHVVGKPVDREDARRILLLLSGQRHRVYTGVCVWLRPEDRWLGAVACSELTMRRWTDEALEAYLDSGQWQGKAGAYGIQDNDQNVILHRGSFTNVVGLPMETVHQLLALVGIRPTDPCAAAPRTQNPRTQNQ